MSSLASINIKFLADLAGFSKQMQNVDRQLQQTGKKLQSTGKSLSIGLTAPIAAFGTLAVSAFANLEQELAKVRAVSGATDKQFAALEKNARMLGETTRFTATEVAGLQLNYSKLGFNPEEILEVTQATLELSLATGEDLAQSATVAASTLRGFGLDATETQRVVDVMAKSFSSSALDLMKFETAMAVVAPVAKTAGQSIEDTTGFLSVLVNAGIDASTAGTGLRNIFLDLAEKGITLEQALGSIVNSSNKNATALELFGKRGATVATVLADNFDQAKNFTQAYNEAGGSAARMAAIMDNTLQGSFFRLKSAAEGFAISIGETLAPFINKVAGLVTKLISGFTELSPNTKRFIVILGGIAAAVGPLLALAGTILPAIATGFAILTGPIGLVIAGVTAIAAIIARYWTPIKKTLIDIANYFIDLYNESLIFRIGVEAIANAFKNAFEVGKFAFEFLKNLIGSFAEQIKNTFVNIGAAVKAILTGDFDALGGIFKKNLTESANTFKGFTAELSNDWKTLTGNIESNTKTAIDNALRGKKVEFISEEVNADAVETEVKDKVSSGVQQGLLQGFAGAGGAGTGAGSLSFLDQLESDLEDLNLQDSLDLGFDVDAITAPARAALEAEGAYFEAALAQGQEFVNNQRDTVVDGFVENFNIMQARLEEFNEGAAAILQQSAESFAGGFGEIIGGIASGNSNLGSIAGLFLNTIADMAIRLGKLAISIGIAVEGIKKALSSLNPGVAIAAGIALIALGTLVKSAVANIGGGGGNLPAFADGGIVGGSSFYGDKILARVNSGELILNQQQQKAVFEAMNNQPAFGVALDGDFRLSGEDLILAVDRTQRKLNRKS